MEQAQSPKSLRRKVATLMTPVSLSRLPPHVRRYLEWARVYFVGELVIMTELEVRRIRSIGPQSARKIAVWLARRKLCFDMRVTDELRAELYDAIKSAQRHDLSDAEEEAYARFMIRLRAH